MITLSKSSIAIIVLAVVTVASVFVFTSRPQHSSTVNSALAKQVNTPPAPLVQPPTINNVITNAKRPDSAYKTLYNIWDDPGLTIFKTAYLSAIKNPRHLLKFPRAGMTAYISNTKPEFWSSLESGAWEPEIWELFHYVLDGSTTLVDFGTWIGPTVLFGAQLARRTFGIEGDPAAFAQVSANVKYNADAPWYPRVHLQPACVHVDDNSVHTMKSKNVGDSASSIGKVHGEQPGEVMPSWKVRCFTLAHFFKMWDINPEEEHVVVKIDVESYECDLIPSFFSWLQGMKTKPTLLLAMHSQITYCSQAQYADIAKVAKLFKFVTPGLVSADGKSISGHTGDYMLSDIIVHPHLNV